MAFQLKNKQWCLRDLPLSQVLRDNSQAFYLYDLEDALTRASHFQRSGLSVHYAMKANSCPRLLRELSALGLGADVVSLGELNKALKCGFPGERIIFSGVAKDRDEFAAALQNRIYQINVESFEELQVLHELCVEKRSVATIGLRLNIHLTAPTHKNVQTATPDSKFGLDILQLPEVLAWLRDKKAVQLKALATHIGSQIVDLNVFAAMAKQMGEIYRSVVQQGFPLERLDLGGGLGIDYRSEGHEDLELASQYLQRLQASHQTPARLLIEPGRFLTARMGALLAKVIYVKRTPSQNFAILNAGMNCLMRPALYQAYHRISPIEVAQGTEKYTVVGPICESTDKFAEDRELPLLKRGDWLAVFDVGAYGATMANTYNESPLPKEWSYLRGEWEVS